MSKIILTTLYYSPHKAHGLNRKKYKIEKTRRMLTIALGVLDKGIKIEI